MAESFVSCQSIFYPVIMVKNICIHNIIMIHNTITKVMVYQNHIYQIDIIGAWL